MKATKQNGFALALEELASALELTTLELTGALELTALELKTLELAGALELKALELKALELTPLELAAAVELTAELELTEVCALTFNIKIQ